MKKSKNNLEESQNKVMYKSNAKSILYPLILILIYFSSCKEKEECLKFIHEEYLDETVDSVLVREVYEYREILLNRFDETPINGQNHEAYHLLFYSTHGFGKSVKFEKKETDYFLTLKCLEKEGWLPNCKNYQIKISKEDWNELENMIYEFNFWTEKQFKFNSGALDGFVYFLEGSRPDAEKCNKRTYRFIGRGSPRRDKIGALCDYINEYENQLAFRYGKRN